MRKIFGFLGNSRSNKNYILIGLLTLTTAYYANGAPQKGGFLRSFSGQTPLPFQGEIPKESELDLTKERFYLFIPKNYDGSEAFGILSFTHSDDSMTIPKGWEPILQEKKLLYLAPQNVGNQRSDNRRISLTLAGILKMLETYHVNPRRVFTTGMSGGARIALQVGLRYPDVISGTIPICGADFYKPVKRIYATNHDNYGVAPLEASKREKAKQMVSIALITGENDFRRGNILDIYNEGFSKEHFKVKLFDVPGMGHEFCKPDILRQAIEYVDAF